MTPARCWRRIAARCPRTMTLLCGMLLLAPPAWGMDWYRVSVLVFARDASIVSQSEFFPIHADPVNLLTALDLSAPYDVRYQLLPAAESALADADVRLAKNPRYRVLFHRSWTQPGLSEAQANAILITGGQPMHDTSLVDHSEPLDTLGRDPGSWIPDVWSSGPATPSATELAAEAAWQPVTELEGTFTLVRERFLHALVDLNFVFRTGGTVDNQTGATAAEHQLRFTARQKMRSREFHYLDHPVLGVIVYAEPFQPSDQADDIGATTAGTAESSLPPPEPVLSP